MRMGKHYASCGCELKDGDFGRTVVLGEYGCDAGTGFHPQIAYHNWCAKCEYESREWDTRLWSEDDEKLWFLERHPAQKMTVDKRRKI